MEICSKQTRVDINNNNLKLNDSKSKCFEQNKYNQNEHESFKCGTGDDDDIETKFEMYKIENEELNSYSLEDCLKTKCLNNKLETFYSIYSNQSMIKYVCNHFEIERITDLDKYENMAKKSQSYFKELLKDYATKKSNETGEQVKLVDLQKKLWTLNGGQLVCKTIKENENCNFYILKIKRTIYFFLSKYIKY